MIGRVHKSTTVNVFGKKTTLKGGVKKFVILDTPKAWCEYYGVTIKAGKALLFKGVKEDFRSDRGGDYSPGSIPVCTDWDGGVIECGNGYHLSPHPQMTKEFCTPIKYIAGWVKLTDMAIHPDGVYPQKCKIHKYAAPVWECDVSGNPVEVAP